MPIYTYKCDTCGSEVDEIRLITDRERMAPCTCGGLRKQIISTGGKHPDHLYPYIDDNIAAEPIEIRSRSHYLSELKKRGLQERDGGKTARWV